MTVRNVTLVAMVALSAVLTACGQAPVATAPMPVTTAAQSAARTVASKYPAHIVTQFNALNADRNETLSKAEFVEGSFAQMRFLRAPSATEVANFKAGLAEKFTKADKNKDSKLTLAEFAAMEMAAN